MTRKRPLKAAAACAALALIVALTAANAQEFLSPKPMAQRAPAQKQPARPKVSQTSPSQAAAGSAAAKPEIAEEIGDWRLQCFGKPSRVCQLSQQQINKSNHALLIWVEFTQTALPKPAWQLAVMVPLGLRIEPDLGVRADNELLVDLPIVTCVPAGCVHSAEMPLAGLDTLRTSQALETEISDLQGRKYALAVPMQGFKDAYLKSALFMKGAAN